MRKIFSSFYKAVMTSLKYFVIGVLAMISAVFIFEYYLHLFNPQFKDLSWKYPTKPNIISHQKIPFLINDAQYIAQASYASADGTAPWENKDRYSPDTQFNIKSNLFGFFTKYPINAYPRKKANEYRIILVGGSGAQGNGATNNEKMFYSLLENKLNEKLSDKDITVDVINLASPGQYAATNELLLHYWGHDLEPNLILMYNGANDIAQPALETFIPNMCAVYGHHYINAPYEYPNLFLKNLSQKYPFIFHVYGFGPWIKKVFYNKYYEEKGLRDCLKNAGYSYPLSGKKSFDEISYPSILKSMKAIKRDFCGIPIVFSLQAIHEGERSLYDNWIRKGVYQELYTRLSVDLKNYYNKDWYFINVDKIANAIYREKFDAEYRYNSIGIHLDDLGQEIVANILAEHLYPIIENQLNNNQQKQMAC